MPKKKLELVKPEEEILFDYTYADYFRNIYANGVWGGLNPYGEIVMNFFLEKAKPPEKVKYKLTEKTKLYEIERTPKEDKRIRELQIGIVLNLNVARSIKNWLEQKIEEMESVIAETKKGS